MTRVRPLYERLLAMHAPVLGGRVGDFPLYEAMVAGCASRAASGQPYDVLNVPEPDEVTLAFVTALRNKGERTQDEQEFLAYFDLLEEIRSALSGS